MVFHRYRWLATVRKAWISLFLSGALPAFPDLFSSGLFSFSAVPSPLFLPRSTPTPTPRLYARFSRLNFAYSIPCSLPLFSIATSRLSLFHSRRRERERAHLAPSTEQLFLFFFFFFTIYAQCLATICSSFLISEWPIVCERIKSEKFRFELIMLANGKLLRGNNDELILYHVEYVSRPTFD